MTSDFVKMQPNRARIFLGGDGLDSTVDFDNVRATVGNTRAEQVRRTAAKIVVANRISCLTQFRNLIQI